MAGLPERLMVRSGIYYWRVWVPKGGRCSGHGRLRSMAFGRRRCPL